MPEIAYQLNNIHSYIKSFNIKNFKINSFKYAYSDLNNSSESGGNVWNLFSLEDLANLIKQDRFQLNKFYVKTEPSSYYPNDIYGDIYLTYITNSSKETKIRVSTIANQIKTNQINHNFKHKSTFTISYQL